MPAYPREEPEQPPEPEPEGEERQPEPEAVRDGQRHRPASLPADRRETEYRTQSRPHARSPGQREHRPEYRRPSEPGVGQPMDPDVPLQPRYESGEGQPEHDDERADHDLHDPLVYQQRPARLRDDDAGEREHDGEPGDDKRAAQQNPPPDAGSRPRPDADPPPRPGRHRRP